MIAIIGSGPAGVAAAIELLKQGQSVTMIDGGQSLEPEIEGKIRTLQSLSFDDWDQNTVDSLSMDVAASAKGVQLKLAHGSDYPYRKVDEEIPRIQENIGHCTPSLAVGGFSTVWGSAMLPFIQSEISDWPLPYQDLEKWYRSVLSFVPLAAQHDALEQFFPLHKDKLHSLALSKQADRVLERLKKNRSSLKAGKFYFGSSRVAVFGEKGKQEEGSDFEGRKECCYCGRCLYGCPYNLIYSTTHTLRHLVLNTAFTHISGIVVQNLKEEGGRVVMHGKHINSGEPWELMADRVLVGAGVISTARLMLSSLGLEDKKISAKTSEYFLLPLFSFCTQPRVEGERLHTLAQLFIEIFDKNISEHSVHMQLYTYSDLYRKAFKKLLSIPGISGLFRSQVLSRLLVIQGYTHSSVSSSIELSLANNKEKLLKVCGVVNPEGKRVIQRVARRLCAQSFKTGFIPCLPMLSVGKPGEGRHIGGTFPMKKTPGALEADLVGRISGVERIHLIDASVFPSIPASTISLTIMANAQRIASEVARLS